jgi:hypothetical protein
MDSWSVIAPTRPGFRQSTLQQARQTKALAGASKPPRLDCLSSALISRVPAHAPTHRILRCQPRGVMGLGPAHGQGLLGVFRPANDLKTALRQSVGNAENSAPIKPDFKSGKQRHRSDVGPSIVSRRGREILRRNEASGAGEQELPRKLRGPNRGTLVSWGPPTPG